MGVETQDSAEVGGMPKSDTSSVLGFHLESTAAMQ